jgi:uncharacterized protein (DUF433 family)
MAATAAASPYPHISKRAGVCGGRACIEGTRVRVMDIVALHSRGCTIEEMLGHFNSRPLTRTEVYSALAYYHDHQDEIEASFAAEERVEAEHEKEKADFLDRQHGR